MSIFYRARVSSGKDGFSVLIKADSISQARSGLSKTIIEIDRATDSEIFEAGKNGEAVLNLVSEVGTDDQPPLPLEGGAPAATTGGNPSWLSSELNPPAVNTGD